MQNINPSLPPRQGLARFFVLITLAVSLWLPVAQAQERQAIADQVARIEGLRNSLSHNEQQTIDALLQQRLEEPDPLKARRIMAQALKRVAEPAAPPALQTSAYQQLLASTAALVERYQEIGTDTDSRRLFRDTLDYFHSENVNQDDDRLVAALRRFYDTVKRRFVEELNGTTAYAAAPERAPTDAFIYELNRHDALFLSVERFFPHRLREKIIDTALNDARTHYTEARQLAKQGAITQASAILEHSSEQLLVLLEQLGIALNS